MSFKKNKYLVLRNVLSKELSSFVYKYFLNKRSVAKVLFESKFISPFTEYLGFNGMMNKCQILILIIVILLWKLI